MQENNKAVPEQEQQNTGQGAEQTKELSPEEKLTERERLLDEREKAIEAKERKAAVTDLLKSKNLPPELADFINAGSDEEAAEKIGKLSEILNKARPVRNINTGFPEGDTPSRSDPADPFMSGFKK